MKSIDNTNDQVGQPTVDLSPINLPLPQTHILPFDHQYHNAGDDDAGICNSLVDSVMPMAHHQ